MFWFLSQVLQHPLWLHVLTSRIVWSRMFERWGGETSLCSPTDRQLCMRLGSGCGCSPDVRVSLLLGLKPGSQVQMCNLSWAVLSKYFNPVLNDWEKSLLYSWAIQQPDTCSMAEKVYFWFVWLLLLVFWHRLVFTCILGSGKAKPISSTQVQVNT